MTKPISKIVAEIDAQLQLDPAYLGFHGHSQEVVRLRTDDWLALKTALATRDAEDAARYRWLKATDPATLASIAWRVPEARADSANDGGVDEAIDTARNAQNR